MEYIKSRERFEDKARPDAAGHPTVGYGHRLLPGEEARFQNGIDREGATKLLKDDLTRFENAVRQLVKNPLTQHEYDALVSLAMNIGEGRKGFAGSTTLRELNAGNYAAAADAMRLFNKLRPPGERRLVTAPGLVNRREADRSLFLHGKYD
jgi:lysozyme